MRIVLDDGSDSAAPDPSLLRLLIRANAIRDRLLADRSLTSKRSPRKRKWSRPMRRVSSVSRYWPPILLARSSTATSRRNSQHESSWTTRGCRLIGTSSGGPSASPEASALFSQRIVRLISFHSLFSFWLARQKYGRSRRDRRTTKTRERDSCVLEPAFADRFVSGGPAPAALHGQTPETAREFPLSK